VDDSRFRDITARGMDTLRAIFLAGEQLPGQVGTYNAYIGGTEVVVLGYHFTDDDGSRVTKPVCILMDEQLFATLRVDDESARTDEEGNWTSPLVE